MKNYDEQVHEFSTLKPKHRRIAAFHVKHPEASQADCYWSEYPNAKRASANQRGNKVFQRDDFKAYCQTLRNAAASLAQESIAQAKLRNAIIDPTSEDAISVLAEMAVVAYETLDENYKTPDFAVVGYGKGLTEVQRFDRPLNHTERLSAARFVRDTTQVNKKDAVPTATVVIQRLDTKPPKVEVQFDDDLTEDEDSETDNI